MEQLQPKTPRLRRRPPHAQRSRRRGSVSRTPRRRAAALGPHEHPVDRHHAGRPQDRLGLHQANPLSNFK